MSLNIIEDHALLRIGIHTCDYMNVTRSPGAEEAAADLLRVLANPHRVAIVMALQSDEQCVHELVEALSLPQPLVSQHLRILKAQRVVTGRRRGREIAYSLLDLHVGHIVADAVEHAKERNTP